MKRTFDNYTSNQLPANHQSSNDESYMLRNIINNQRSYFATLINEENFGHLIYELNNNPEYVYKCILDYGRINNNNSQYIETLDYLLREYKGHYHAIFQMINWSLEDGSISTSNYMIDNFIKRDYFGKLFNPLLSTQSRETIVNALTYYFSSKIHLNLDFKEIGGEGLKAMAEALKRNSTITRLNLSTSNDIDDIIEGTTDEGLKAIVEALKHNSTITSLNLRKENIGAEICEAIAEALKHNSSLTSLYLYTETDMEMSIEGLKAIAEALKHNSSLTSLNLNIGDITDEDLKAIAEALKHNSSLTKLGLGSNDIGDEGVKVLAEILKHNASLTSLDLGNNNIGYEGAKALIELLKHNASLTSLNVSQNNVEDEGVKALAELLKHNASLTSLNVSHNNVGDEGVSAIVELLKHNSTLTSLNVSYNNIGTEGRKAIAEVLKHNSTLTSLDLSASYIGDECVQAILEVLKHNSTLTSFSLSYSGMTNSLQLTALKNLLKFNYGKTNLYTKAENAVKCLQKFAVYDATNNSTPELGSQENWQELKKAVKMYLSKPQAIKFVAREKDLSVGETTAITHAAKYRKAAALDDDILACLYFDDSDNQLPWEIVELIGSFYATSLSD